MEDRKGYRNRQHSLILDNREKLKISGVDHVHNFNSELIVIESVAGIITVKGEELDVKKLNIEEGHIAIIGQINSLDYKEKGGLSARGSGFLNRIFR